MGSIEIAVQQSKRIEAQLTNQFGAEGRGLHEKVSSVEQQLPRLLVRQIRWIATLRNKAVHEADFVLHDPDEFVRRADHVVMQLQQLVERSAQQAAQPEISAVDNAALWQQQPPVTVPKPIKWLVGLTLCFLVMVVGLELYKAQRQANAKRAVEQRHQRSVAEKAPAGAVTEPEKSAGKAGSRAPLQTPGTKTGASEQANGSPSTPTASASGGTTIKVATSGLASKVQQAQDGLSEAKQQLSQQLLQGMMQQLQVSVGEISAAAEGGNQVALLLPLRWTVDQRPLLAVVNSHFRDYKGRKITGGKVDLDDGRDRDSVGIVIKEIWNKGEYQHRPHSEVLYQWLAKHQLRLEAHFAGHKATLVLASGRRCHASCSGRGDDQFQLLTSHQGGGKPLMMYGEQNPLRITGLNASDFGKQARLSLALVLVDGNKEIARRDLSQQLPAADFASLPGQADSQWQQVAQRLQQSVLGPIRKQAKLQVGELRVEPAKAGHSNLYIPLHWQLPSQTIVAGLNAYFHDYRQRSLKPQSIEVNGSFGPKQRGIEVVRYANEGNRQKHPLSERAYQLLLDNPIGVRANIGDYEGRLYLASGMDCHVRCRGGGDDRYRILFSDKQSGKNYGDRRANELLIEGVPNSLLSDLDGLTLTIDRL